MRPTITAFSLPLFSFRVESDVYPPSRQEVLTLPDSTVSNVELQNTTLSAREAPVDDIAEEFKQLADMQRRSKDRKRQFDSIEEMNNKIMGKERSDREVNGVGTVTENKAIDKTKDGVTTAETKLNDKRTADKKSDVLAMANRDESVYLSKKNLREHERMMGNTDEAKKQTGVQKKIGEKKLPDIQKSRKDKPHQQTNNEEKGKHSKDSKTAKEENIEKLFKPSKAKKRRRLPPISGLVLQSSRAESYRSIYIRRQQIAAQMIKDQQVTIRRSQSTNNIHEHTNVPDELKDNTLKKLKSKPVKGGDDEDSAAKSQREKIRRDSQTYFTRGTKDRYNHDKVEFRTDIPYSSRSENKGIWRDGSGKLRQNQGSMTERVGMDKKIVRKHVKERILWDKEREDMYMKEMDMFTLATNEAKETDATVTEKEAGVEADDTRNDYEDPKQNDVAIQRMKSGNSSNRDIEYKKSSAQTNPLSQQTSTTAKISDNDTEIDFKETETQPSTSELQRQQSYREIQNSDSTQQGQSLQYDSVDFDRSPGRKSSLKESELQKVDEIHDVSDKLESVSQRQEGNTRAKSGSNYSNATNSKPIKLIISSEVLPVGNQKHQAGLPTKTKTGLVSKTNPSDGSKTARLNNKPVDTPRSQDAVIRDKLTVEIDVKDGDRESSHLTREKAKIKRFWEVVGGKEGENEEDMYGEPNQTDSEKILMTRVKKERKMSARSKSSKQSDATNLTSQKLGKYNVTVEVV